MEKTLLTSLPDSVRKQILSDPCIGTAELYGAVPRVFRSLGALAAEVYGRTLYVTLRSTAEASSFAQWVGKHGQHLRQLHIMVEGNWLDERAWSEDGVEPGFGVWSRLWNNMRIVQSAQPRLESVVLRTRCTVPGSTAEWRTTPNVVASVVVSNLALIPQLSLRILDLAEDWTEESDTGPAPQICNRVLPAISKFTSLQQLQIVCTPCSTYTTSCLTTLSSLTKLVIAVSRSDPHEMPLLLRQMTLLEDLSLNLGYSKITSDLADSIASLTALTSFSIMPYGRAQQPGAAALTGLTKPRNLLQLMYTGHGSYLQHQLPQLTGLQSLTLTPSGGWNNEDGELYIPAIQSLVRLTRLELLHVGKSCRAVWDGLPHLSNLKSLAVRNPRYCGLATAGEGIAQLAKLQGLTRLAFNSLDLQDEASYLPFLSVFTGVTGLEHLELCQCDFAEDHVASIAANLKGLTHLTLQPTESTEVGHEAMSMLTLLTGLQQLHVDSIYSVDKYQFRQRFPQLAAIMVKVPIPVWED